MSNKQQINEGAKPQTTTVIRGVTPQIQSDRPTVTGGVQGSVKIFSLFCFAVPFGY